MKLLEPSYFSNPDFKTGEKEIKYYEFDCLQCENTLSIDLSKQTLYLNGRFNISEGEEEHLNEHFGIGHSGKSHEGGDPVFSKVSCNCGTEYYTYCGVNEFANSAYTVQVQSIVDTRFFD